MERVIYKYPLSIMPAQSIALHLVHKLLTVQLQDGKPMLWAIVNPASARAAIMVHCYGTGNGSPRPDDEYIGTVQLDGFVWHFFLAA